MYNIYLRLPLIFLNEKMSCVDKYLVDNEINNHELKIILILRLFQKLFFIWGQRAPRLNKLVG